MNTNKMKLQISTVAN